MEFIQNCPVCGNVEFVDFLISKDYFLTKEDFTIVQCKNCNLKLTNPRPTETDVSRYYESKDYLSHDTKSFNLRNLIYSWVRIISIKRKIRILDLFSNGNKILDIGCGTGEFIAHCRNSGWDVTGIEPNHKARTFANQTNRLSVFDESGLQDLKSQEYDVITMWHVLEHVHKLNDRLTTLGRLLKQDGLLIIAVPNTNSWDAKYFKEFWAAYDLPRHLYHFSQDSIGKLLHKFNFKIEKIIPMKFDAYYISLLSQKYLKGTTNYFSAIINGFRSNQYGKMNNGDYSSIIFVIKRKNP